MIGVKAVMRLYHFNLPGVYKWIDGRDDFSVPPHTSLRRCNNIYLWTVSFILIFGRVKKKCDKKEAELEVD